MMKGWAVFTPTSLGLSTYRSTFRTTSIMKHTGGMCVSTRGGVFAPGGYVSAVPEGFKEYYHGPQDIPPEHRIFAYPEKAEPVHSILAALKRFQEAPPAPKKDKAGPSHEER